jgi:hypothetical protein
MHVVRSMRERLDKYLRLTDCEKSEQWAVLLQLAPITDEVEHFTKVQTYQKSLKGTDQIILQHTLCIRHHPCQDPAVVRRRMDHFEIQEMQPRSHLPQRIGLNEEAYEQVVTSSSTIPW